MALEQSSGPPVGRTPPAENHWCVGLTSIPSPYNEPLHPQPYRLTRGIQEQTGYVLFNQEPPMDIWACPLGSTAQVVLPGGDATTCGGLGCQLLEASQHHSTLFI